MNDYSWIKPGVKAVITQSRFYPELVGEVITITSEPYDARNGFLGETWKTVSYEPSFSKEHCMFKPRIEYLKPHKDDSHEKGSWEEIEKIIGKDIRQGVSV